jgi:hypothetical protein
MLMKRNGTNCAQGFVARWTGKAVNIEDVEVEIPYGRPSRAIVQDP